MEEIEFVRASMRHSMIVARGGMRRAVCDNCGQRPGYRGLELHELVNRNRTVNAPELRALTYQPELSALLCQRCHGRVHNPAMRDQLFRANYRRYGYSAVLAAFERLQQAADRAGRHLDIHVPCPEGDVGSDQPVQAVS